MCLTTVHEVRYYLERRWFVCFVFMAENGREFVKSVVPTIFIGIFGTHQYRIWSWRMNNTHVLMRPWESSYHSKHHWTLSFCPSVLGLKEDLSCSPYFSLVVQYRYLNKETSTVRYLVQIQIANWTVVENLNDVIVANLNLPFFGLGFLTVKRFKSFSKGWVLEHDREKLNSEVCHVLKS